MRRALVAMLVVLAACSGKRRDPHLDVAFAVRVPVVGRDGALDDDPLRGATRLESWVEDTSGQRVDGSERTTPLPATSIRLPTVPFGSDFVIRIDALDDGVLLGRGRSFGFDVGRGGPSSSPNVFLGSMGRFGRRASTMPSADVRAALPTRTGALLALADGHVARFDPFASSPLADLGALFSPGSIALAVGRVAIAAFDPSTKTLVLVDEHGTATTPTHAAIARHGAGVMLVADASRRAFYLVGGYDDSAGEVATAVTRVTLDPGVASPTIAMFPSLPATRWGGTALFVPGATSDDDRVVVLGGSSRTATTGDAYFLDPAGGPVASVDASTIALGGASFVALDAGAILAVGGSSPDDVRRLVVTASPASLVTASPSPSPLAIARDSPALVGLGTGLVLAIGGTASGSFVAAAELVDVRTFPGQTVQTGRLPPLSAPFAVRLDDHAAWVFDRNGIFGYVQPRGD